MAGDLPGLMRIVAGQPGSSGSTLDSLATLSRLHRPLGVAAFGDGTLYIADERNARILAVRPSGAIERVLDAGAGPCVQRPAGLALDADGNLVLADPKASLVCRWSRSDGTVAPLAGNGSAGTSPDGTPALDASLAEPFGVAVGADGRIYFSERGAHRVRTIDAAGALRTVAGDGSPSFGGDGGPATAAGLDRPAGLGAHAEALYIADASNDRIRSVDLASGVIHTVAGSGVRGFGGDGGPAADAPLNQPLFVTAAPDGRTLYLSDTENHRVRAVDLSSGSISTLAGTGETAFNGDLQDAGLTALWRPGGLAASAFGVLFIGDTEHHIVWRTGVRF